MIRLHSKLSPWKKPFCGCYSIAKWCPTLCNTMDCSPAGSSAHGISQARILEWVVISSPGDLPHPGIKPTSPALQADSLPLSHRGSYSHHEMKDLSHKRTIEANSTELEKNSDVGNLFLLCSLPVPRTSHAAESS